MPSNSNLIGKIKWAENFLQEKGIESPRLEAEVLIAHLLGKNRVELYRDLLEPLSLEEEQKITALIEKRAKPIPTAYLTGYREFMSLDFKVNEAVLIPRPETEIMVEAIIDRFKNHASPQIVDVGTGSGAIAVSLAKYLPNSKLIAIDISPAALEVARENAILNQVSHQISFLEGNLLNPVPSVLKEKVECIAANLPYIPEEELEQLQPEVRCNEPALALIAGADGFDLYRKLLPEAYQLLAPKGLLVMEIGYNQEELAPKEMSREKWQSFEVIQDFQGLSRFIQAQKA